MRWLRCVASVALALGLASAAAADQQQSELFEEVEAFGDALEDAVLADDVDAILAMYLEDAVSLPNYGPRMDGVAALREHHEGRIDAGTRVLSFMSDPSDVWQAGAEVIEIGTYELELATPGVEKNFVDWGKYMTVYVRDDGGALRIKASIWNSDLDAAAPRADPEPDHDGHAGHHGHEGHGG